MSALSEAVTVIESAGFIAEQEEPSLLRIKTKEGKTIGSVTLSSSMTDEQAAASAKESVNAAAREPIARKLGRRR